MHIGIAFTRKINKILKKLYITKMYSEAKLLVILKVLCGF